MQTSIFPVKKARKIEFFLKRSMIKIDAPKDFFDKKFVTVLKFSTKFFRPHFLIVKSPNWQDSYTTYPKISANQEITPNKCRLFIIMSHINFDNWPHPSKKNRVSLIVRKKFHSHYQSYAHNICAHFLQRSIFFRNERKYFCILGVT